MFTYAYILVHRPIRRGGHQGYLAPAPGLGAPNITYLILKMKSLWNHVKQMKIYVNYRVI
jgi:hypothetical protein